MMDKVEERRRKSHYGTIDTVEVGRLSDLDVRWIDARFALRQRMEWLRWRLVLSKIVAAFDRGVVTEEQAWVAAARAAQWDEQMPPFVGPRRGEVKEGAFSQWARAELANIGRRQAEVEARLAELRSSAAVTSPVGVMPDEEKEPTPAGVITWERCMRCEGTGTFKEAECDWCDGSGRQEIDPAELDRHREDEAYAELDPLEGASEEVLIAEVTGEDLGDE